MESRKAGIIVSGVVTLLIILILIIRGVSIRRKDNKIQEQQYYSKEFSDVYQETEDHTFEDVIEGSGVRVNEDVLGVRNTLQKNTKDTEGSSEELNTDSSDLPVEKGDSQVSTSKVTDHLSLNLIDRVEVVSSYEANVLISSKNIYKVNNSCYAYALSMIIPLEGTGYQLVDYLCSVATWNSVNAGDSIVVTYGLDDNGIVLIKGLSKD